LHWDFILYVIFTANISTLRVISEKNSLRLLRKKEKKKEQRAKGKRRVLANGN